MSPAGKYGRNLGIKLSLSAAITIGTNIFAAGSIACCDNGGSRAWGGLRSFAKSWNLRQGRS